MTDDRQTNYSFGEVLRKLIRQRGIKIADLSNKLRIGEDSLYRLFKNIKIIDSLLVEKLIVILQLSVVQAKYFWTLADGNLMSESELNEVFGIEGIREERQVIQDDLRERVDDLQKNLHEALSQLAEVTNAQANPAQDGSKKVLEQVLGDINTLRVTVGQLQNVDEKYYADVELPPREDIKVKLVSLDTIDRLSEHMQDGITQASWATLFFGTLLGILTNLITGGEANPYTWVVVFLLIVVSGVFGFGAYNANQRAERTKNKLFRRSMVYEEGWWDRLWSGGRKEPKELPPPTS